MFAIVFWNRGPYPLIFLVISNPDTRKKKFCRKFLTGFKPFLTHPRVFFRFFSRSKKFKFKSPPETTFSFSRGRRFGPPTKLLVIKFWEGVKYGNFAPYFSTKVSGGDNPAKKIPSGVPWEFYDVIMASYPPNFQDLWGPNLGTQLIIKFR